MRTKFVILCFVISLLGSLALAVAPTILTLTPSSGAAGTKVTLHGSYFTGATAVQYNGTNLPSFTVVSAYYITVIVPGGAVSGGSSGPITVITPGGSVVIPTNFTLDPAPTIRTFSPASGPIGQSVSITGANFTGATAVKFNGTKATFQVASDSSIIATVSSGTTSGKITLITSGGTATSATNFTIIPAPTISSVSPISGKVGTKITLHGSNLTGATSVRINSLAAASYTVVSANYITLIVPAGATTGPITVVTPGGTVTSATNYTVITAIPVPSLVSFTPLTGLIGQIVMITGNNFTGATAVKFNGTAATFNVVSATTITSPVPTGSTTGPITVTTPGGTAASATNFAVLADADTEDIFNNWNIGAVENGSPNPTTFTITRARHIVYIDTYHYFNNGVLPGTISLRHQDGTVYGPWQTIGLTGQGGVANAIWVYYPSIDIKAGSYTVLDSNPATWSNNSGSNYCGFSHIRATK